MAIALTTNVSVSAVVGVPNVLAWAGQEAPSPKPIGPALRAVDGVYTDCEIVSARAGSRGRFATPVEIDLKIKPSQAVDASAESEPVQIRPALRMFFQDGDGKLEYVDREMSGSLVRQTGEHSVHVDMPNGLNPDRAEWYVVEANISSEFSGVESQYPKLCGEVSCPTANNAQGAACTVVPIDEDKWSKVVAELYAWQSSGQSEGK